MTLTETGMDERNSTPRSDGSLSGSDMMAQLRDDMDRMRQRMEDEYAATKAAMDAHLAPLRSAGQESKAGSPPADARKLVDTQEWAELLVPQSEAVEQSAQFVLASPFIRGNVAYRDRLEQVSFYFAEDDDEVNAYATDSPVDVSDHLRLEPPAIVYLGGLGAALRLASAAVAGHVQSTSSLVFLGNRVNLTETFQAMGAAIVQSGGRLDGETCLDLFETHIASAVTGQGDQLTAMARSLAASMDMFVVAHEAGHIALAHTLGKRHNHDVSRNQEREADSFAASALSTSPFREYLFIGQVFVTIVFAWEDEAQSAREPGTHPLGRERFLNALASNSEAAKEAADRFGLSRERLVELLPPDRPSRWRTY